MTKISVILPTNKINTKEELDKFKKIQSITQNNLVINKEFTTLCNNYLNSKDAPHILTPTLLSLVNQSFIDFEVILCHKHPEDIRDDFEWICNHLELNGRLIKEKSSIWHELGDKYRTVNNIRNTGLIHAKGELILFLDDYTVFNKNLLQNAWDAYQDGYYITARGMRRIRYDPKATPTEKFSRKSIVDKNIYSSYNFNNIKEGEIIPISATWTYCCSVSLRDCLSVNGFDEIWDGNFGGTDQDFGRRLEKITKYKRKLIGTIYEFSHKSPRMKVRNDEIFRAIIGQTIPKYIKANNWKPTKAEIDRYKRWHRKNVGKLDSYWDKFMNVPLYNIGDFR